MITRASQFAKQAHAAIDQRRKYTLEPYIVHPAAVARLVTSVTDDEAMICAAWLHDVVEDTAVTIAQIEIEFNHDIASLVADLTDVSTPADGNREARKLIDLKHTQAASPRAKTVKLADLIDNSGSISLHDPRFARIYMAEKRRLLGALQQGDQRLFAMANEIVEAYYKD
ncbi:MAG: HD domain-containing protein [Gammaproteobacteria bacterium]|nr:HD domain-containing protein [Gammaproteobacteria bacterium]